MGWRIALPRALLSVLLVAHLVALAVWNLPTSALRERLVGIANWYFFPAGLWQNWGMFAPDPMRETVALEAEVRDAHGMRHSFAFPAMAGVPVERAVLGYRHSKFAHNMAPADAIAYREFAARHAVRALGLGGETFPVEVELGYRVWRASEPGEARDDEMTPPEHTVLQVYIFPNREEAQP